jgi:hypothetical protein
VGREGSFWDVIHPLLPPPEEKYIHLKSLPPLLYNKDPPFPPAKQRLIKNKVRKGCCKEEIKGVPLGGGVGLLKNKNDVFPPQKHNLSFQPYKDPPNKFNMQRCGYGIKGVSLGGGCWNP